MRVLVHEVTSWDARRDVKATREWGHTHVDEIIPVSEGFTGEALVLVHRVSRRHAQSIRAPWLNGGDSVVVCGVLLEEVAASDAI